MVFATVLIEIELSETFYTTACEEMNPTVKCDVIELME